MSGTLKGQLTIAAEDDIVDHRQHDSTTRIPGGTDVLGLVGDNNVAVCHNTSAVPTSLAEPRVDAAILALQPLVLRAELEQRAAPLGRRSTDQRRHHPGVPRPGRNVQGQSADDHVTGYNKDYTYDTRLKYLSPPYFLSPTQSAWQRISYAEIKPTATP